MKYINAAQAMVFAAHETETLPSDVPVETNENEVFNNKINGLQHFVAKMLGIAE